MNYSAYEKCDMVNGEGIRCSLWVSGCAHHCEGCFNKKSWKFSSGQEYTEYFENKLLKDLENEHVSGLSLLGGEPLHHRNLNSVTGLCKKVKALYPHKSIWLWTGYVLEEVKHLDIMTYIDVLIDGKFEESLHSPELMWRGSSNQKVYKKTKELKFEQLY